MLMRKMKPCLQGEFKMPEVFLLLINLSRPLNVIRKITSNTCSIFYTLQIYIYRMDTEKYNFVTIVLYALAFFPFARVLLDLNNTPHRVAAFDIYVHDLLQFFL